MINAMGMTRFKPAGKQNNKKEMIEMKAKLYPQYTICGITVLYQPFDYPGELAKRELWHIYVPSHLESYSKSYLFPCYYERKEECLLDFFEMNMNMARAGKLNLRQIGSLISIMKEELNNFQNKKEIEKWIEEADQLYDELVEELEKLDDLYEELGGHQLKTREKRLIGVILDLQRMEGDDLRHRFVVNEEDEELERYLEEYLEDKKEKTE